MRTLIIVESPHKAQAVAELARPALKGTIIAWACLGHLRDLPVDRLGIDIEHDFQPEYAIPERRQKTALALGEKITQAERIILATDPDREGEAVAWHVLEVFKAELQGKQVQRVTFNSLTPKVVQQALRHPRKIDLRLVQAAVARRVLDRLVGYFISPALWKGLRGEKGLSAGRVQSAALRLLVEQESSAPEWAVEIHI